MPNERPSNHDRPVRPAAAPATRPKPPQPSQAPSTISVTLHLHGPEQEVIDLAGRLKRELDLRICLDTYIYLPDDAWDQFPSNFLMTMERRLVREDLRLSSYEEIMNTLHISRNTIHAYRTRIRSKFLSIEPDERPDWMRIWLRLYPGQSANRRDEPELPTQRRKDAGTQRTAG